MSVHCRINAFESWILFIIPDSKVHGANMGPTWLLSAPGGPHVSPINLAISDSTNVTKKRLSYQICVSVSTLIPSGPCSGVFCIFLRLWLFNVLFLKHGYMGLKSSIQNFVPWKYIRTFLQQLWCRLLWISLALDYRCWIAIMYICNCWATNMHAFLKLIVYIDTYHTKSAQLCGKIK